MSGRARKILVRNLCLLCGLAAFEILYRMVNGLAVLEFRDFRQDRIISTQLGQDVDYDPVLGWRPRSDQVSTLRVGASVLLVGNAATLSGPPHKDSLPAMLETTLAAPVVNGAVHGHGANQIITRAEKLLPAIRPQIVVSVLTPRDIERAGGFTTSRHSEFYSSHFSCRQSHGGPWKLPDISGGLVGPVKSRTNFGVWQRFIWCC
jgi:hypothetical protein